MLLKELIKYPWLGIWVFEGICIKRRDNFWILVFGNLQFIIELEICVRKILRVYEKHSGIKNLVATHLRNLIHCCKSYNFFRAINFFQLFGYFKSTVRTSIINYNHLIITSTETYNKNQFSHYDYVLILKQFFQVI